MRRLASRRSAPRQSLLRRLAPSFVALACAALPASALSAASRADAPAIPFSLAKDDKPGAVPVEPAPPAPSVPPVVDPAPPVAPAAPEPPATGMPGRPAGALSLDEVRAALSDASLSGCYPNGDAWAELTAADGALYDLTGGAPARVGTWSADGPGVCYSYDASPAISDRSCFAVRRREGHLDFHMPYTDDIIASTDCAHISGAAAPAGGKPGDAAPVVPPAPTVPATPPVAPSVPAVPSTPAPSTPPPPPLAPSAPRLSDAELRAALSGASLSGCFTDGATWSERTGADGVVYDMAAGGVATGVWSVADGEVCYVYAGAPLDMARQCFEVARRDAHLDFYAAGSDVLVASTDCSPAVVAGAPADVGGDIKADDAR